MKRNVVLFAFAAAAAGALAILLHRELFGGRAQSFDTLLYARSLWGLAHGDLDNPVIGLPTFAVHGHFLLLLLAPFARLAPAALVLALAQAAALGATLFLVARAFADAAPRRPLAVGLWGGAIAVLATPLVINPFFFDARPDLLGLPFLVGGLLRGVRRGGLDGTALGWMLPAALAREELALVIAVAALLCPASLPWRRRALVAAAAVAYFAFYYFGLRAWLGGSGASAEAHLRGSDGGLLAHRAELLVVFAASAGGLVWWGRRWLPAAVPGLALLLASGFMPDKQIATHYGMFAAPGLLAAAVAGYRAARPRAAHYLAWSAVALACFVVEGAAPGGRRFAAWNYDLAGRAHGVGLVHERLARLPATGGLAAPWPFAAPLADRAVIWTDVAFKQWVDAHQSAPAAIETVALAREDFPTLGRFLAGTQGFHLDGFAGRPVEVLTRGAGSPPWETLGEGAPPCDAAVATWPDAGLRLCALEAAAGKPAAAWLRRDAASRLPEPLLLVVGKVPLWALDGLVDLSELPVGVSVRVVSDEPLAQTGGAPALLSEGRPLARD